MSETIAVYDRRIYSLIDPDAKVEKLAEGAKHTEGPVYLPEDDSCSLLQEVLYMRLIQSHRGQILSSGGCLITVLLASMQIV